MGDDSAPATGSTAGRTRARTRARERMADKLAEQRRREREVQGLLEGFLKTEDTVSKAEDKRAAAVARADADLAAAEESVKNQRAEAVSAMRKLGQSVTDIADLTGLPAAKVRLLIQHGTRDTGRDTPEDRTPDAEDRSTNAAAHTPSAENGRTDASGEDGAAAAS